jgi:hypothetical protein
MTHRTAPHRPLTTLVSRRTAGLIAFAALAIGCGAKIDSTKAEQLISQKLAEHGFPSTVACPKDQAAKTGATFTCEATGTDGTKVSIVVTQKDDQGNVEWKPDGVLVDTSKIAADAKSRLGGGATVSCPRRAVLLKKTGDTTSCAVRDGQKAGSLQIKVEDAEKGSLSWEVKPA